MSIVLWGCGSSTQISVCEFLSGFCQVSRSTIALLNLLNFSVLLAVRVMLTENVVLPQLIGLLQKLAKVDTVEIARTERATE